MNISNFPKIAKRYLSELLDLSFGSRSETSTLVIAGISSVLLSISSWITTYNGLSQFSIEPVAFCLALGIQGILFTASWRIAFSTVSREVNVFLYLIYFVTMFVSVSFSYVSLFDEIYSK